MARASWGWRCQLIGGVRSTPAYLAWAIQDRGGARSGNRGTHKETCATPHPCRLLRCVDGVPCTPVAPGVQLAAALALRGWERDGLPRHPGPSGKGRHGGPSRRELVRGNGKGDDPRHAYHGQRFAAGLRFRRGKGLVVWGAGTQQGGKGPQERMSCRLLRGDGVALSHV